MIHKTPEYQEMLDTLGKKSAGYKLQDLMNGSNRPVGLNFNDVGLALSLVYGVPVEFVVDDLQEEEDKFYEDEDFFVQVKSGEYKV